MRRIHHSDPRTISPEQQLCTRLALHASANLSSSTQTQKRQTAIFDGCTPDDTSTITEMCDRSGFCAGSRVSRAYRRLRAATRAVFEAVVFGVRP
jgi:hypothetical protein